MQAVIDFIKNLFHQTPILAIFVSIAIGFAIGSIPFGKFRLGGVAGSLIAGVLVSLTGITIDDSVKNLLFALFIFAVGFDSGPTFFSSLGRKTLREVGLAVTLAATGLLTVFIVSNIAGFDKGLAAGLAAGGLTQSAIMGVAGDALTRLDLTADQISQYTANIGVGYAVTYIFGTLGAIIVCVGVLPKFMGKGIRDAAIDESVRMSTGLTLGPDESLALNKLVGRVYRLEKDGFADVKALEAAGGDFPVTVEKVRRAGAFLDVDADLKLVKGDILLLVGQREAIVSLDERVGPEVDGGRDMDLVMKTQETVIANSEYIKLSINDLAGKMKGQIRHGVYVLSIVRGGRVISLKGEGQLHEGDVLKLYGSVADVDKAVKSIGTPIIPSNKTDMILTGVGIIMGLLIGMLTLKLGGIPLTLGSGGGVLLAGLFFGWIKMKKPQLGGTLPSSASLFLKDFGLAGFVAVVGLNSGLQAISTIAEHGVSIFVGGLFVTIVPLLITMVIGRYLLGYRNTAVFAGALTGSRSANPAFGQVLDVAGNAVPTVSFAVTYALANVFLTLLGPIIVALV